ncbi:class I SAM-dependent methyltransferase [Polynucleobacter asymbioticus]|jgi:SAM-dependent methyltransferase|uniref:Methyltransferase n=1 Tax=Polynucleobacter asymbioticus TaxID=576611 RepID=A0AAC9ITN9_9BURK|nr:class I SAM-dependent methyltransferase [Polynucleobacter asymbioticus]APB98381.1 methyltransferase [Polynucleobacter asymbioticus]APC00666.1 methyltransferase [Polynucleobacter asymbioticus]
MDLKEIDVLGSDINAHWYYKSKATAATRFLKNAPLRILDVGAGSGFFSRYLLRNTAAHNACCVDINYQTQWEELEGSKSIVFRKQIEASDANLVLIMDVLEHVEDDVGLLKLYAEKVSIGTDFLISVPAFDFLWSSHDEFLEHHRRYTIREVESLVQKSGLEVVQSSYYFGCVFPIAATLRLLERFKILPKKTGSQLVKHSFLVNSLLNFLCKIEMPFIKLNRTAGLTVFCLATKKHTINLW